MLLQFPTIAEVYDIQLAIYDMYARGVLLQLSTIAESFHEEKEDVKGRTVYRHGVQGVTKSLTRFS